MKPIDFRNETFDDIYGRLNDDRMACLQKLREIGPSTTRNLAEQMGLAPEFVRPRVTELYQIGAVDLVDSHGHEGVYQARFEGDWILWCGAQKTLATSGEQLQLAI